MRFILCLAVALAIGCSPTEPGPPEPCTYALSATAFTFGASGGTAGVGVDAGSGCTWTAASNASWLSVTTGSSGTGPGVVSFAIAVNSDPSSRTGVLTIADKSVTVVQEGKPIVPCTYVVSPTSASFEKDGGTGQVTITASSSCAWTAQASAGWVTITSGDHGTGNGTVSYSVAKNENLSGRIATITAAGFTIAITQNGNLDVCLYTVNPVRFTPCMNVPSEITTNIETAGACPWTATAGASWITVTRGGSGTGSGVIGFTVTSNYEDPRSSVVMVRWPTPTAGQNVQVLQAGCHYAVSKTDVSFPSAGGTNSVDVFQQSDPLECGGPLQNGCVWRATSTVNWITITSSMPKAGDDRFSFQVDPNGDAAARSGSIVAANKTVQVTQAGTGMSLGAQLLGWARDHVLHAQFRRR